MNLKQYDDRMLFALAKIVRMGGKIALVDGGFLGIKTRALCRNFVPIRHCLDGTEMLRELLQLVTLQDSFDVIFMQVAESHRESVLEREARRYKLAFMQVLAELQQIGTTEILAPEFYDLATECDLVIPTYDRTPYGNAIVEIATRDSLIGISPHLTPEGLADLATVGHNDTVVICGSQAQVEWKQHACIHRFFPQVTSWEDAFGAILPHIGPNTDVSPSVIMSSTVPDNILELMQAHWPSETTSKRELQQHLVRQLEGIVAPLVYTTQIESSDCALMSAAAFPPN